MEANIQPISPRPGDALIIVDVQNDFLPGGSLAVPDGDAVVAPLNTLIEAFEARGLPIFATRDWHPENHCSFKARGGPWPPHCIAETPGAQFAAGLRLPASATIVSKATMPDKDAYSGFGDTELDVLLRKADVQRLFIGGLATDYCVLNTVRDALSLGYEVMLVSDAVRAVDVEPGDGERAIDEMRELGAIPVETDQVSAES
jgi:nicotinamidase/pyrazinamidase